jgi:hypothetical protein
VRKSVLVLGGAALLVGTALWFESQYRKAENPSPVQPIGRPASHRNDSTQTAPQAPSNAPSETGLLIG